MISKDEIIKLIEAAEEGPTLDYKEDLPLAEDGDKAQFVKDVIALANGGDLAHIIVGVEDGTGKPVGLRTNHTVEQLNQILKDKCDPPVSIEYAEKPILGYQIGIIEIKCENPPYIVSVPDKFGGRLSTNPSKSAHIHRGTVYVRNYNINQGAKRADLDKIYDKIKYVSVKADVQISHEILNIKTLDNLNEVDIEFFLHNIGEVIATDTLIWMQFNNVKEIVKCNGNWQNMSNVNENIPTVGLNSKIPLVRPIRTHCNGIKVRVEKNVKQIESRLIIGASNMITKEGSYFISLKVNSKLETL